MPDVELLIVGGGGAGGTWCGGGGGAGGVVYDATYTITEGTEYVVTVGRGGPKNVWLNGEGAKGQSSFFDTTEAYGGGGGGAYPNENGINGGSGGGVAHGTAGTPGTGVAGQGYAGGDGSANDSSGGGGGAGEVGHDAVTVTGGTGGVGVEYPQFASVAGSPAGWFAGGGGGWGLTYIGVADANGGGGDGTTNNQYSDAEDGVANTGGGGGGAWYVPNSSRGGAGGSGLVIIRYQTGSLNARGGTKTTSGGYTLHTFIKSGTFFADADDHPWGDAGPDQRNLQYLSTPVQLNGSATDDGLPDPPAALTYLWTQEGYYDPAGSVSASNAVPTMTSDIVPSGRASASATYNNGQAEAWCAFGGTNGWLNNGGATGWVQYEFDQPKRIGQYKITPWSVDSFPARSPKDWTLLGSNDGATWTTLDTQTNYTSWVSNTPSTFDLTNTTRFRYFRLNVTANGVNSYLAVKLLALYERVEGGSGAATFDDDTDPQTTVTFDEYGTYVLRLTADDSVDTGFDDVEITLDELSAPPARVSQATVEAAFGEAAAEARVSHAAAEVVILTDNEPLRVSQVVAEILAPMAIATRVTQIVVELLGKTSTYCGEPSLSPAALCGKPDVLAWLEWTVPMKN